MLVHNKGKFVRHAAGVMLVPGTNNVDENDFKQFSNHPLMTKLINKGEIEPLNKSTEEDDSNDGDSSEAESTKDLNADKAIEMVKDTYNLSLLEEWKEQEDRSTVVKAIDTQLGELKGEDDSNDGDE